MQWWQLQSGSNLSLVSVTGLRNCSRARARFVPVLSTSTGVAIVHVQSDRSTVNIARSETIDVARFQSGRYISDQYRVAIEEEAESRKLWQKLSLSIYKPEGRSVVEDLPNRLVHKCRVNPIKYSRCTKRLMARKIALTG